MQIEHAEPFSSEQLLTALRRTRLRGFGGARPYLKASLELLPGVDPDLLVPAQRYVLRDSVKTVLEMRDALLARGLDMFALDGGAYVTVRGESIPVIPPIVEQSNEPDGRTVLLINDGMHRVFAARSLGVPIAAVIIRGVPPEFPYYAQAVKEGWSGVAELDELPDGFQKKEYRHPDNYKALFREFNEVFPGVQKERKKSNPAHLRA